MAAWVWVLIPITAILVGAFNEWLKFKAKQQQLGTSTDELESTMTTLRAQLEASEQERAALVRRIQNLETIVTSQLWDAMHDDTPGAPEKERLLAEARLAPEPPEDVADAERVERMARRLKV